MRPSPPSAWPCPGCCSRAPAHGPLRHRRHPGLLRRTEGAAEALQLFRGSRRTLVRRRPGEPRPAITGNPALRALAGRQRHRGPGQPRPAPAGTGLRLQAQDRRMATRSTTSWTRRTATSCWNGCQAVRWPCSTNRAAISWCTPDSRPNGRRAPPPSSREKSRPCCATTRARCSTPCTATSRIAGAIRCAAWTGCASSSTRSRACVSATQDGSVDLKAKGAPGEQPEDLVPWFDVPGRKSADVRVVCGHWSTLG